MVLNTITVSAAVTPAIISTSVTHYLKRKPLRQKPTAHIEYHQGIALIRSFLHHASFHTVDEVQAFTAQWVPVPTWVKTKDVYIPETQLEAAARLLREHLGEDGLKAVGGETWWTWRGAKGPMKAEWIEMRNDYHARKRKGIKSDRIMLYIHGGAYYFGSVDEHRYQMQRHARKLKARVLAPRYRLAPQFPFPCGLYDCLATYLWLLEQHDPSSIILAGDSAGGGMTVSMLCLLRDAGIPLPAGAILLSPWVDLTHSFPSLGGDGKLDYIPAHGFIHKPSMTWPPPNKDDVLKVRVDKSGIEQIARQPFFADKILVGKSDKPLVETQSTAEAVQGFQVLANTDSSSDPDAPITTRKTEDEIPARPQLPTKGYMEAKDLEITIDGKLVRIRDQIQIYAPNHLLSHPLVSPVLQPSLGGLPPLLIQVGGGELLCDEQIYLAHKAANPTLYRPSEAYLDEFDPQRKICNKWDSKPTHVQLQVWEDLCHVAHTLSWTRPAKYMYRSVAQFGAWALARAQKHAIDIVNDDDISIVSTDTDTEFSEADTGGEEHRGREKKNNAETSKQNEVEPKMPTAVGRAGDPLPPFENHMIRQRVDRHGTIFPLAPPEELPATCMNCEDIGAIKEGPVRKWMDAQQKWNGRFAREKRAVQKKRVAEMAKGYKDFEGEYPPATALAGRRKLGEKDARKQERKISKKSWGMALWSLWGSKHDETTIDNQLKAETAPEKQKKRTSSKASDTSKPELPGLELKENSHVIYKTVTDEGQAKDYDPSEKTALSNDGRLGPLVPVFQTPPTEPPPKSPKRMSYIHGSVPPSPVEGTKANELPLTVDGFRPPTPTKSPRRSLSKEHNGLGVTSLLTMTPANVESLDAIVDKDAGGLKPGSPNVTVIPPSDTLSTRPTRGGIAYPFKLRADDGGKEVNASTVTLVGTPADESDGGSESAKGTKIRADESRTPSDSVVEVKNENEKADAGGRVSPEAEGEIKRPAAERFETAREEL